MLVCPRMAKILEALHTITVEIKSCVCLSPSDIVAAQVLHCNSQSPEQCDACAEGSAVGDKIFLEGGAAPSEYAKILKSDPWRSIVGALSVQNGQASFEGKALSTCKGAIAVPREMPDGASIH